MPEHQKAIYFITGEEQFVVNSPQLEGFKARGIEVLLLTDSVDQFWVNVLNSYQGIDLKSVTASGEELDAIQAEDVDAESAGEDDKKTKKNQDTTNIGKHNAGQLIGLIKDVLGEHIKDVRVTSKLSDSPVCLSIPEGGMDIRLERFMVENKQLAAASPKIFEINPSHPIIIQLAEDTASGKSKDSIEDRIHLLFAQANIIEGEPVPDIGAFSKRFNKLLESSFAA